MYVFLLSFLYLSLWKKKLDRVYSPTPPMVGTKYRTFPTFESLVPHVSYHFPTLFALSRPLGSSVSNLTFQLFASSCSPVPHPLPLSNFLRRPGSSKLCSPKQNVSKTSFALVSLKAQYWGSLRPFWNYVKEFLSVFKFALAHRKTVVTDKCQVY